MTTKQATLGDGRFMLHSLLGQGDVARVYRAYDRHTQQWRALRVLRPDLARHTASRYRFAHVAQALTRLEHPNVVRIYQVVSSPKRAYIVMELCDAGTIADWVTDNGPMPAALAVDVLIAACRGAQAAHATGVFHHDMRPEKLLIRRQGGLALSGFAPGRVGESTQSYSAPEQGVDAGPVDARADVFSLGLTLLALLTGELDPRRLAHGAPQLLAGVVAPLSPVIERAIATAVEQRYPGGAQLLAALEGVAPALPAPPVDTPSLIWRELVDLKAPPMAVVEPATPQSVAPTPSASPDPGSASTAAGTRPRAGASVFQRPQSAPEPFLSMTPASVERVQRPDAAPAAPSAPADKSSRSRFDALYVTEVAAPPKRPDPYVDTLVSWQDSTTKKGSASPTGVSVQGAVSDEPATPWLGNRAAVALSGMIGVGLGLLGLLLVLSVGGAAEAIETARSDTWQQRAAFRAQMDAEYMLPQHLAGLGADAQALFAARHAYRTATTASDAQQAARALAATMSAELAVLSMQERLPAIAERELSPRIRALQAQRRVADQHLETWRALAHTPSGGLAMRFGGATPPPER